MENQEAYGTGGVKVVDRRIQVEPEPPQTTDLVLTAMNKGYTPELIEKMMDLAERNEKNVARKAFFEAFAQFKEVAPPVKKDKYNNFFKSWYTSLGALLDTYNPVLGKFGLSMQFPTPQQSEKSMTVECRLGHRLGHTETVSMTGPIDAAAIGKHSGQASRNPLQDLKSTFTYLRAATCEAILGVAGTEGTVDDDGNAAGGPAYIDKKQLNSITDMILARWPEEVREKNEAIFLNHMKADSADKILATDFQKAVEALKPMKVKK